MVSPQVSTYFEVTGKLQQHPVSELLSEIAAAGLSGSLRLENGQHKVIVYFNEGNLVYAASNARQHRLFDLLLRSGTGKEQITGCRDLANDQALAAHLMEKGVFDKETFRHIFGQQLSEIILFVIGWDQGEWTFNALARVKEEICQEADLSRILLDFSKGLSGADLAAKFNSKKDVFSIAGKDSADMVLSSQEYFVLSRLDQPSSMHDVSILTGFGEAETAKILYTLWLGGFVRRKNWEAAFSPEKINDILTAEIKLKEKPKKTVSKAAAGQEKPSGAETGASPADAEKAKTEGELSVEEYLAQVEKAETFYDVLGVDQSCEISEIKAIYFSFARRFHPDRYHHQAGSQLHQRIQNAFTQIAQAYETLKDTEAREVYNFKVRRQLEKLQKRKELREEIKAQSVAHGIREISNEEEIGKLEQAREEFDYGFDFLMNQDNSSAIPFFARAVNLAPKQARYHAYYGKALSHLDKNRHQAEQEIFTAIKIEPQNTAYRLMLIEFYIDANLPKRAEGELKKLLAKEPHNEDAKILFESLQNK
jgi:hypothetical protein